jgi:hypothetical protein
MAFLYTVKSFSDSMGSLVREAINRIKSSIESRIGNAAEAISHHEVTQVITQIFTELSQNIRQYAARTAAGIITIAVLSGVIYIAKNILLRGVNKIKNKADFFALLSARSALVLAVILNLSFFAKLAIWFGYLAGIIIILTQALIIFLLR